MNRHGAKDFLRDQRGAVAIIVALLSVVLIGFAALAVDGGYLYWSRTQLQATADASALAGVQTIPDNTGTLTYQEKSEIIVVARTFAQKNMRPSEYGNVLTTADVVPGHWDADGTHGTARTFYPLTSLPAGAVIDAVKVITRRDAQNDNPVRLFFAGLLGFTEFNVGASAVAYADVNTGEGSCYEDEILAGGEVTLGSDTVLVENRCVYGRDGVTFVSGPVIEEGTTIAALASGPCFPAGCSDCGAQCGTINYESQECYVPEGTADLPGFPPEENPPGTPDRLTWLQTNGYCNPLQPAVMTGGVDMQPEQANSIGDIIDKIQSGSDRPSHITNVIVINGPANIPFEMEHPVTGEMRTLMGMTLPPPAEIVPGTAYIFNGNFFTSPTRPTT